MRPIVFLVTALLLALTLGGLYFNRAPSKNQLSPQFANSVSTAGSELEEMSDQKVPSTRGRVLEPTPRSSMGPRTLVVRLLGSQFEEPILGQVLLLDGTRLVETDRQGQARLVFPSDSPRELKFRAKGYADLKAPLPEVDIADWVIHLTPRASTTLIVTDSFGLPVHNAQVRTAPLPASDSEFTFYHHAPQPRVDWIRGLTDDEGRYTWPLAAPSIAEVLAPNGLSARVQVAPGETARVTLATETAALQFVDAESGDPLPGFAITLERALSPRHSAIEFKTDTQGMALVPANQRELVLHLSDPSRAHAETEANPRVTRHGNGYSFRFDNLQPDERITIRVTRCRASIELIDSETLKPITGSVTIDNQRLYNSPEHGEMWFSSSSLRRTATIEGGLVNLDCTYLRKKGRLYLQAPGYAPAFVPQASLEKNGRTTRVLATPNAQGLRVRVLFANGAPFVSKLTVLDGQTRNYSDAMATDNAGWTGPLPWGGQSVTLFCKSYSEPGQPGGKEPPPSGMSGGGPTRRLLGTLAASEIQDGAGTLTLQTTPTYGSLLITDCPSDTPIVEVVDADGIRHRSHHQTSQGVFFEGLIPGPYLAGPPAWLDALRSQGIQASTRQPDPLLLHVQADEVLQTQWDPRWRMDESLTGRIICPPGQLGELALKPWYAHAKGNIGAYDNDRIYLHPDGHYEIPAGSIRPEVLLVCTTNSSYWIQILQAFEPGRDTQLALGNMALTWQGPPPNTDTVTVLYWMNRPEFDTPFANLSPHGYYLEWNTRAPLLLGAVSTQITSVRIDMAFGDDKEQRFAIPVLIEDGKTSQVTVGQGLGNVVPVGR